MTRELKQAHKAAPTAVLHMAALWALVLALTLARVAVGRAAVAWQVC